MANSFLIRQILKSINKKSAARTVFSEARKFEENQNLTPPPLTFLTEYELTIKENVAQLAKEQIAPHVRSMENEGKLKDSIVKLLFENGLMGMEIHPKFNGAGHNFMTSIVCIEELSKIDPAVATLVDIQNTIINKIFIKVGTEEQKEKYLPRLSTNMVSSFALSEASSGSDAFSLKTTAKKDGEYFILNGSKMWISNSDLAGMFLIMANADPSKGYKGITCFIVDRATPGFSIERAEKKMGIIASGTCVLNLDNVKVHESAIVGKLGEGYKIAVGYLNEGRIGIAAQMLGLAQGCLDATIPYTLEREQFGKPIFSFQGMQHEIATIATEIECARLLTYNAARLVEAEAPFVKQAAMAKYYAADVAQKTTIKCINWMGATGFMKDFVQEKFYRDCKVGSIYEGTSNVQLNTIAKFIQKEYQQ